MFDVWVEGNSAAGMLYYILKCVHCIDTQTSVKNLSVAILELKIIILNLILRLRVEGQFRFFSFTS